MKVIVESVHLNIFDLGGRMKLDNPFWTEDTDTYTISLRFVMDSGVERHASIQTHRRSKTGHTLRLKTDNFTRTIKDIHSTEFPDIDFVREASQVHHEPGVMRIFAQSEEEEQEFLKFLGQDIWNSPYYDDHERMMASLALTASTHNYSFHGIATTGSIV